MHQVVHDAAAGVEELPAGREIADRIGTLPLAIDVGQRDGAVADTRGSVPRPRRRRRRALRRCGRGRTGSARSSGSGDRGGACGRRRTGTELQLHRRRVARLRAARDGQQVGARRHHPQRRHSDHARVHRQLDVQRHEVERDERALAEAAAGDGDRPGRHVRHGTLDGERGELCERHRRRQRRQGTQDRRPQRGLHGISSSVHGVRHGSARSYRASREVRRAFTAGNCARSAAAIRSRCRACASRYCPSSASVIA